jgi:hypothetical protein
MARSGAIDPLRREMLRFSQIGNKKAFDEVFVQFGRSLKPDLIVAQWNHLGEFSQIGGDERCLLPGDLWGRMRIIFGTARADLRRRTSQPGVWGGNVASALYSWRLRRQAVHARQIRERPHSRAAIAELAANGGAPMGFYTAFEDPEARREIVRYYGFPPAIRVVVPGKPATRGSTCWFFRAGRVHEGDVAAVGLFKELGQTPAG